MTPRGEHESAGEALVGRGPAWGLVGAFLAVVVLPALVQQAVEIGDWARGGWIGLPPSWEIARAPARSGSVPLLAEMERWERSLEDSLAAGRLVRPRLQAVLARLLRAGNAKVVVGRNGWLFYRPDVELAAGRAFDPAPPARAIVSFRDRLAARGVALVVVPVPAKPAIHPGRLARKAAGLTPNPSHRRLVASLRTAGVAVFDPAETWAGDAGPPPPYLERDTHWRPETAERAARALASFVRRTARLPVVQVPRWRIEPGSASAEGDTAAMLGTPPGFFPPETVEVRRVVRDDGGLWRPDRSADVLVLGDSFANVFSLEAMGWGESAGFVEHLAFALRRPVDAIVRNDAGARATRDLLARELARGRDRLRGKRLVIWQFAARELAAGDWADIALPAPRRIERAFWAPATGRQALLEGTVVWAAPPPRPGAAPYADHLVAVHVEDLVADGRELAGREAVVYLWSMRRHALEPAARLRPGDRIAVRARSWNDVEGRLGGVNRADPEDEALLLADPCFGEME